MPGTAKVMDSNDFGEPPRTMKSQGLESKGSGQTWFWRTTHDNGEAGLPSQDLGERRLWTAKVMDSHEFGEPPRTMESKRRGEPWYWTARTLEKELDFGDPARISESQRFWIATALVSQNCG